MKRLISGGSFWLFVIVAVAGSGNQALGYSTDTHKFINEAIFNYSGLVGYFDNEIKIPITGSQTFQGKTALVLMRDAGEAEDSFPRYMNHYHDPTRLLAYAGLKSGNLGASNLVWAQGGSDEWPNDRTWQRANEYFLSGLTAPGNATREQALGNLFSTLGRLTHLLADMASPAHVRDDAHPFFDGYENWSNTRLTSLDNAINGKDVFRRDFPPDNAIYTMNVVYPPSGGTEPYSTVSNLWDSGISATDHVYNWWIGHNDRLVGLSEYTNYNYLSDDTAFTDYFYPSREEVGLWLAPRMAKDGQTDYLLYFKRNTSDSVLVQYLAATDLVYLDSQAPLDNSLRYVAAHSDDTCYEDYASNLVPRAVSYGTALMDYFFRGKFEVTVEGNRLTVRNLSSDYIDGSITIYADDAAGTRTAVPGFVDRPFWRGPNESEVLDGFYPGGSKDNRYTLVFRGKRQNTGTGGGTNWDDVVAGKVFTWTAAPLPDKIIVGSNPQGLAVTPDGRKLYVANTSSDTVSVVDLSTGEVRSISMEAGAAPVDVAVAPNGTRAYVANQLARSVTVIDTANDNVLRTIPVVPNKPFELAVTPDGRYVYVTHFSFGWPISKIDTADYSSSNVESPVYPVHGIAMDPVASRVYLSYYAYWWHDAVAAVDRQTDALIAKIPGIAFNWGATLAGRSLYVANPGGWLPPSTYTVSVFNVDSLTPLTQVAVGRSPHGVAAGPDGTRVYVANLYDDSVSVIDTASNSVTGPYPAGDGALEVALSPDGKYLFVSNSFEGTVSVMPLTNGLPGGAGQGVAPLLPMASAPSGEACWGKVILVGFPQECMVTVNREHPRNTELTAEGPAVYFPAGTRTMNLSCPDILDRDVVVTVGAGETIRIDGSMPIQ
jgi:YVTN family beta-propeller protein